jgi:hypothetical protein
LFLFLNIFSYAGIFGDLGRIIVYLLKKTGIKLRVRVSLFRVRTNSLIFKDFKNVI